MYSVGYGMVECHFSEVARPEDLIDAKRYRFLRRAGAWESEVAMTVLSEDPAKFDAAVDEAMAAHDRAERERLRRAIGGP